MWVAYNLVLPLPLLQFSPAALACNYRFQLGDHHKSICAPLAHYTLRTLGTGHCTFLHTPHCHMLDCTLCILHTVSV